MAERRQAILYRMVLPDHTCPYGVRAKEMLDAAGYETEERILDTRERVEEVKQEFGTRTTPVVIINGNVIGGCEELDDFLSEQARA